MMFCGLVVLLLFAGLVIPCLPVLQIERQLSNDLSQWVETSTFDTMQDYEVRTAVQRLARNRKIYIPWENINVRYSPEGKILGVGYALPLELPIMYLILTKWVALRFVSLPATRGSL